MDRGDDHMRRDDLRKALRAWARAGGCRLCVLFGSRAGDGSVVRGDVDVALLFPDLPSPERRLAILGELQDACGAEEIDVVFLHPGTDPVLRFEVFRGGEAVFEETAGLFVDQKVRALFLYEDALPFRRLLRERLRDAAAQEGPVVP